MPYVKEWFAKLPDLAQGGVRPPEWKSSLPRADSLARSGEQEELSVPVDGRGHTGGKSGRGCRAPFLLRSGARPGVAIGKSRLQNARKVARNRARQDLNLRPPA